MNITTEAEVRSSLINNEIERQQGIANMSTSERIEEAFKGNYSGTNESLAKRAQEAVKRVSEQHDVSIEDAMYDYTEEVAEYLAIGVLPEQEMKDLEREGETFDETGVSYEELNQVSFERWLDVSAWQERQEERRVKEWLDDQPDLGTEGGFFLYAKIPALKLKIDSRNMWVTKNGKRIKLDESEGLWENWTQARFYILKQIILKNVPKDSQPNWRKAKLADLKKVVYELMQKKGLNLGMNMCLFSKQKNQEETPHMVFSVSRKLSEPTRYSSSQLARREVETDDGVEEVHDEVRGEGMMFSAFVKDEAGSVRADKKPMTGYELESAVCNGMFDREDLINSVYEHPQNEEETLSERNEEPDIEWDMLSVGESAYLGYMAGKQDWDKIEKMTKHKEVMVTVELAEEIMNGRWNPIAARELLGNFWRDENRTLRQGRWLYDVCEHVASEVDEDPTNDRKLYRLKMDKMEELEMLKQDARTKSEKKTLKRAMGKLWGEMKEIEAFRAIKDAEDEYDHQHALGELVRMKAEQMKFRWKDELNFNAKEEVASDGKGVYFVK